VRAHRLSSGIAATLLVAWGLIAAPLLHQLAPHRDAPMLWKPRALSLKHRAGRQAPADHSHGAPGKPGEHGDGSLEHGRALLHAPPSPPQVCCFAVEVACRERLAPLVPQLTARPRVEMPQGP
jgi:hypothetical protein